MDTLNMVEEAVANPGEKYETDCGKVCYEDGYLRWVESRCIFGINHRTLKMKWRKMPKPVDFITAIDSRQRIKVHHNLFEERCIKMSEDESKFFNPDFILQSLSLHFDNDEIRRIILEGEWFIEEWKGE